MLLEGVDGKRIITIRADQINSMEALKEFAKINDLKLEKIDTNTFKLSPNDK